jgi:hypothetical protein
MPRPALLLDVDGVLNPYGMQSWHQLPASRHPVSSADVPDGQ